MRILFILYLDPIQLFPWQQLLFLGSILRKYSIMTYSCSHTEDDCRWLKILLSFSLHHSLQCLKLLTISKIIFNHISGIRKSKIVSFLKLNNLIQARVEGFLTNGTFQLGSWNSRKLNLFSSHTGFQNFTNLFIYFSCQIWSLNLAKCLQMLPGCSAIFYTGW